MEAAKRNIIRIRPRTFEGEVWKEDLLSVGVTIPEKYRESRYTPVAHSPQPFSVEVDMDTMTLWEKITGVIPNSIYHGHIYSWEEFCELINKDKD